MDKPTAPGAGEAFRENLHVSSAVRIGARPETSGQGRWNDALETEADPGPVSHDGCELDTEIRQQGEIAQLRTGERTMQAVSLPRFGGPDAFALSEIETPVAGAGEVLVRVHATSINPLDYQVRRGDYADLVPLSAITGRDISGVVEAVGSGVTAFKPGDAVWYTPQIFGGPGSYAEYHVANEAIVGLKPAALTHLEAASLSLVGGTVWEALFTRAGLRLGESVLVHGAAGGVGHVAVQVAKATGAFVLATASGYDADFVRGLGADVVIDYRSEDYLAVVNRETAGAGVDVILDTIGGDMLGRSPHVLAQLGRIVSIVDIPEPQNLIEAWSRNASYHFVFTRQNRGKLDEFATLVARGQLKPHVGAIYPLAGIPDAHARLERPRNGVRGKIGIAVVDENRSVQHRPTA